jgi:hypothetical protein
LSEYELATDASRWDFEVLEVQEGRLLCATLDWPDGPERAYVVDETHFSRRRSKAEPAAPIVPGDRVKLSYGAAKQFAMSKVQAAGHIDRHAVGEVVASVPDVELQAHLDAWEEVLIDMDTANGRSSAQGEDVLFAHSPPREREVAPNLLLVKWPHRPDPVRHQDWMLDLA